MQKRLQTCLDYFIIEKIGYKLHHIKHVITCQFRIKSQESLKTTVLIQFIWGNTWVDGLL